MYLEIQGRTFLLTKCIQINIFVTLSDLLTGGSFYRNLPKMAKNGQNLIQNGSFFGVKLC